MSKTTIIDGLTFSAVTVEHANREYGYCIDDFDLPVYIRQHDKGAAVISWTGCEWVCDLELWGEGLNGQGVGETPDEALDAAERDSVASSLETYMSSCAQDRLNCAALDTYHTICDSEPLGPGFDSRLYDKLWHMALPMLEKRMAVELTAEMNAEQAWGKMRSELVDELMVYEGREAEASARIKRYIRELTGKEL